MKRIATIFFAVVLVFNPVPAQAEDGWGGPEADKSLSWVLWERLSEQQSYSAGRVANSKGIEVAVSVCYERKTKACAASNPRTWVPSTIIMPVCDATYKDNCVQGLSVYKTGESPSEATFSKYSAGNFLTEDKKWGLPAGGTTSLWKQDGVKNVGDTEDYAVSVRLKLEFTGSKYVIAGFNAYVMPFIEQKDPNVRAPFCEQYTSDIYETQVACGGGRPSCAWADDGVCGKIVPFAEGTRAKLSMRISNSISGWFAGRAKSPDLEVTKLTGSQNLVIVDAEPVDVAQMSASVKVSEAGTALKKAFLDCPEYVGYGWCGTGTETGDVNSFKAIDLYRSYLKDKSSSVENMWSFRSIPNNSQNRCLSTKSKILGIVTTNSMAYEGAAPQFSGGFLNYRVSGMHFLPDGKTNVLGTYDLVMRSDTARCLYGFSKAPLSATVSVTGGSDKNVATTVVSENKNWLKMAAYNFTFSKKTIKVKITKKK